MFAGQGQGNIMFSAVKEEPSMSPAAEVGLSVLPYAGAVAAMHYARKTSYSSGSKYTLYDIMQKTVRNLSDATPLSFFNTFRLPEMMSPYLSPEAMGLETKASLLDPSKQVASYTIDSKFTQNESTKQALRAIIGEENFEKINPFMMGGSDDYRFVTEFDPDKRTSPGRFIFQRTEETFDGPDIIKKGRPGTEIDLGNIRLGAGIYSADTFDYLTDLDKTGKMNPFLQGVYQNLDVPEANFDKMFKSAEGDIPRFLPIPTVRGSMKSLQDMRARTALPTAHLSMGINRFNRLLSATFNQVPILGRTLEDAMDTNIPGVGNFSLKTKPGPFYKQFANIGLKTSKLGAAYLGLRTVDHYRRNFDFVGNLVGSAIVTAGATGFIDQFYKQKGKPLSKNALGMVAGSLFGGQMLLPGFSEGVIEGVATTFKNIDIGMSVVGKYTGLSYYRRGIEGLLPGFTDVTTGLFLGLGVAAASYASFGEKTLERTALGERTKFDDMLSRLMPDAVRERIGFRAPGGTLNLQGGSARTVRAETLLKILDPVKIKGEFSDEFKMYNPLADAFENLPSGDPLRAEYRTALNEVLDGRDVSDLSALQVKKLQKFHYINNDLFKKIYSSNKTVDVSEIRAAQIDAAYNMSQKADSEVYRQRYVNNQLNESLLNRIEEINTRYQNPNFLDNILRRTEIFGAEMYHSFFGATLSGELDRDVDGEIKKVSYDKLAGELDAKPIFRRFGALAVGTALIHQVLTTGIFGSMEDPDELVDEYSGKKLVEIKKGRFWEAGGTAYEGGATSYFRPSLYASLMSRAAEKSVWGDDAERFNPISKFFLKNFTYHLEEKNYYTRPYPISSAAFKDIPIIGDVLAATIGQIIKPPKLMHQNELVRTGAGGEKQMAFTKEFGSSLEDGTPRQAPMNPYNVTSLLGSMQYQFRELEGLTGFAKQTFQDFTTGRKYLGTENMLLDESYMMDSTVRDFWDAELGGMAFLSEPLRRILPRERSEIERYNPIKNSMPSYIPDRYKQGDPYRLLPQGFARLPGAGYEALNPELKGMDPEDYPDIHKYKILADIAPKSRKTMMLRQKLFERRAAGVTTEFENEMMDRIVKDHQKRIAAVRNYEDEKAIKIPVLSDITSSIYSGGEKLIRKAMSPVEQGVPGILGFGFRPSAKLLGKTRDAIETYEYERLYGTSNAFWDQPFRDSFRPALYSAANLMGWSGKPAHVLEKEELNEQFDKLQFMKFMNLARSADNNKDKQRYLQLAAQTRTGVNPQGDALSIYLSLPEEEKRFFETFTQAQGAERDRILEMVPEDQASLYKAIWSRIDAGEDIGLYSGNKPNIDINYMQRRYSELEDYFRDKPMPGPDWIGWHKDVDVNDIKVKYVENLGGDIHDYDMWESQVRRNSRRPYLEGSDLFMHEDPRNITSNPYTNLGFSLIDKGLYNSSGGIYENSRAEIYFNDNRNAEISALIGQALRG